MPKLHLESIEQVTRTSYPLPYREAMAGRHYRRLGPPGALSKLGASHVVLDPGGISSQRHWHEGIDELVIMLEGEAVLVEEDGETVMRPGDIAAFPADVANGHHLVNRSGRPCVFIAIDNSEGEGDCHYPDIDLHLDIASGAFTRKDGSPW
jgi:uncharacterized cupin superfamily protein